IVGVADQNVEDHTAKELARHRRRCRSVPPQDAAEILIAAIVGFELVEAEDCERGNHRLARPALALTVSLCVNADSVETLDEQHILTAGRDQIDPRGPDAS